MNVGGGIRLRHVGLTVADLERSLKFWRDGAGLEVLARQDQDASYIGIITGESNARTLQAVLRFPGTEDTIELLEYTMPIGKPVTNRPRNPGVSHIAIDCRDIDGMIKRLLEFGGGKIGSIAAVDRGVNRGARAIYLRDPDNHIVELVQTAINHEECE